MAILNFENTISVHSETSLSLERKKKNIIGQTIEKVHYVIANYQNRPYQYDGFHLGDEAIFIQLSNHQFISWVWLENYAPNVAYCYHLYYDDLRNAVETREQEGIAFLKRIGQYTGDFSDWVDVTASKDWKGIIGKKVEDVRFQTKKIDGIPFLSDVTLNFEDTTVNIIAIEEPDPSILPKNENLNFDPVWTMVVFDDTILKTHNRP